MSKYCIVYRCQNREDQGLFIGDLCAPCYEYVNNRPIPDRQYSQAWRNALKTASLCEQARQQRIDVLINELKELMK
jgi:hypothetical protein